MIGNGKEAPVQQKNRITSLDIVRGFALIGVLMMNMNWFSSPNNFLTPLIIQHFSDLSTVSLVFMDATFSVFSGSTRALFSILFGAGLVLITQKIQDPKAARRLLFRRNVLLLLFGMVNVILFMWWGDILIHYAVFGAIAALMRNWSIKLLLCIVIVFLTVGSVYFTSIRMSDREDYNDYRYLSQLEVIPEEQQTRYAELTEIYEKGRAYNLLHPKNQSALNDGADPRFGHNMGYALSNWVQFNASSLMSIPRFAIDALSMMLLGIVLFRTGWLQGSRPIRDYQALVGICLPIAILLSIYSVYYARSLLAFEELYVPAKTFYHLQRSTWALSFIAIIHLLLNVAKIQRALGVLQPFGQMALTNYLMQSLICMLIFMGFAGGLYGRTTPAEQLSIFIAIVIFQVIFSNVWLKYFKFGPAEWLWRSGTYWKWQPLAR